MSKKEVERILKLDPKERTPRNIKILKHFFLNCKYVMEQCKIFEEKTVQYLFRYMRFAKLNDGETVFKYGEEGT